MAAIGKDKSGARILNPDGTVANVANVPITGADAMLLRQYKKFLQRMGLREALYCNDCWNGDRHDGCDAAVTDNQIIIKCRCTVRSHFGMTF